MKKSRPLYRIPSTCHVCGKKFLARYSLGKGRARVCTLPSHLCKHQIVKVAGRRDKSVPCVEGCCRSKYARGASAASMDSAIDPRYVLSDDEFARMMKASRKLDNPEGITIRFIARTGCRLQEALLVRRSNLEIVKGVFSAIRIPTLKRAGRPVRRVYLSNKDDFTEELKTWAQKMGPDDLLFPVARRTLQRKLEKILDVVKPNRASLVHLLRHTRASQLIAAGGDWGFVRQQLGWATLEMAKRYVHTNHDAIETVLGKI